MVHLANHSKPSVALHRNKRNKCNGGRHRSKHSKCSEEQLQTVRLTRRVLDALARTIQQTTVHHFAPHAILLAEDRHLLPALRLDFQLADNPAVRPASVADRSCL